MNNKQPPEQEKKRQIRPTIRQQMVAKILVEKGGSLADAMREAGYKEGTVSTPQKVTEAKGFLEIFKGIIPDEKLVKRNNEMLDQREGCELEFPVDLEDELITKICHDRGYNVSHICLGITGLKRIAYVYKADTKTRSKALELGYKARGVTNIEDKSSVTMDLVGLFEGAMRLRVSKNTHASE